MLALYPSITRPIAGSDTEITTTITAATTTTTTTTTSEE
jgi:hypothetical protein